MNITINLQAPELAEAINNLAGAIMGKRLDNDLVGGSTPKEDIKPIKGDSKPNAKAQSETPIDEPKPEELRAKAAQLSKAGKREEVKALLSEFEVGSVTAVPEGRRADFMKRLEDLE